MSGNASHGSPHHSRRAFHPPLLAVAHGSRDPRSAATVRRLVDAVLVQAPGLAVRTAFLDLNAPTVPAVLADLHAEGHREVTVVPLLLGSAYHARVDLPELITGAAARTPGLTVNVADVLGADPLLQELALARVAAAFDTHRVESPRDGVPGRPPSGHSTPARWPSRHRGVVLTGVGSSHAAANAAVARVAAGWQARGEFAAVTHAFATCEPSVSAAVAALHARGIRQVVVAPWFLAPGLLLDRVAAQARAVDPGVLVAEPLGSHPAVADVVLARYTAAATLAPAA